jgi:hypothetical protein
MKELINDLLKAHATRLPGWDYAARVARLHQWARRFNRAFGLKISTPAIRIENLRVETTSCYQETHNGLGLEHVITVNPKWFDASEAEQLVALFRELLRQWQHVHGEPSGWRHYNREFRDKARDYGVSFDTRGRWQKVAPGPFTELLAQHKVDIRPLLRSVKTARKPGRSTLKKWTCGCTILRAGSDFQAECLKCGKRFVPARSSGRGRGRR